jgi:hypothetical protein
LDISTQLLLQCTSFLHRMAILLLSFLCTKCATFITWSGHWKLLAEAVRSYGRSNMEIVWCIRLVNDSTTEIRHRRHHGNSEWSKRFTVQLKIATCQEKCETNFIWWIHTKFFFIHSVRFSVVTVCRAVNIQSELNFFPCATQNGFTDCCNDTVQLL